MTSEIINQSDQQSENQLNVVSIEDAKKLGLVALEQEPEQSAQSENASNQLADIPPYMPPDMPPEPEKEKLEQEPITRAMAEYLLATRLLSEIKERDLSNFIDKEDLSPYESGLAKDDGDKRIPKDEKIININSLELIYKKANERRDKSIRPNLPLNFAEIKTLKHDLKINHVLKLGEILKDYLDNKEVRNINDAKKMIAQQVQSASVNIMSILKLSRKSDKDFTKSKINEISNLFNGMRHESAFKEMIFEGNSTEEGYLFDIEETDYDDDLHGIDMRIVAQVLSDQNGNYYFPSTAEEFEQANTIAKIDIDIKASEDAVDKALHARKKTNHDSEKGQPLIMWSHVYNDDFRLDLSEGRPTLGYSRDEALLYFKYSDKRDGQLDAMKRLHESPYLKYHDASRDYLHPDNFDERYAKIKSKLLNHINEGNAKIEQA